MADVTIYKPAAVTVAVVDGDPPVDQSVLVASLQAQVATLTAQVSTLTTANTALQAKITAAQAALA